MIGITISDLDKLLQAICPGNFSTSGTIKVSAVSSEAIDIAIEMIKGITDEPEQGKVYNGKVVKIVDFGAFVLTCGRR